MQAGHHVKVDNYVSRVHKSQSGPVTGHHGQAITGLTSPTGSLKATQAFPRYASVLAFPTEYRHLEMLLVCICKDPDSRW